MRPKERRDSGQNDLFKGRLDQIVDMGHPLAKLAAAIDWGFVERRLGAVYTDAPGQPPLPTRLMAGLAVLKHMDNLSDDALTARWLENPYYQLFCGEEFFRHKTPFDRSSMTRWRQRMGEERLNALLQESVATATRTGAAKPADFTQTIVDTTVQPKAVAHPTDAKLTNRAREKLVRLAKRHGVALRQSYERVGKRALIAYQRYAHAKQFKRANRALRTLRTYLGRVMRDIKRKIRGDEAKQAIFRHPLWLAERVSEQRQNQRGKIVGPGLGDNSVVDGDLLGEQRIETAALSLGFTRGDVVLRLRLVEIGGGGEAAPRQIGAAIKIVLRFAAARIKGGKGVLPFVDRSSQARGACPDVGVGALDEILADRLKRSLLCRHCGVMGMGQREMLTQIDQPLIVDAIVADRRKHRAAIDTVADAKRRIADDAVDRRAQGDRIGRDDGVVGCDGDLIGHHRIGTDRQDKSRACHLRDARPRQFEIQAQRLLEKTRRPRSTFERRAHV